VPETDFKNAGRRSIAGTLPAGPMPVTAGAARRSAPAGASGVAALLRPLWELRPAGQRALVLPARARANIGVCRCHRRRDARTVCDLLCERAGTLHGPLQPVSGTPFRNPFQAPYSPVATLSTVRPSQNVLVSVGAGDGAPGHLGSLSRSYARSHCVGTYAVRLLPLDMVTPLVKATIFGGGGEDRTPDAQIKSLPVFH
jgi:hypothetical protein